MKFEQDCSKDYPSRYFVLKLISIHGIFLKFKVSILTCFYLIDFSPYLKNKNWQFTVDFGVD